MKHYETVDLTGDSYLNPVPAIFDNGQHNRPVGAITSIAIHHDASIRPHDYDSIARYRQEAAEHYKRLGPGLQYHYKIDNTGTIFHIRPDTTWLYAVGSGENVSALMICLDGNFEVQQPTREQFEALSQLLIWLCESRPDFPATYPNVRSHSDYSATACCGANLRDWVFRINSRADVERIPDVPYDWPEYQPAPAPVPPAPAPAPAPVDVLYEDINTAVYVAQVATHLDEIKTGQHVKEFVPGTAFEMSKRALYNGKTWLVTSYSAAKGIANGVPEKDLIIQNAGSPTPPADTPPPPVPDIPPANPGDKDHINERLTALEKIVAYIVQFFGNIFSKFTPPK